jgi:hypothetical protein
MLKDRKMQTQGSASVTNDIIRRFNRDTGWLATGVLGSVVFAALALAVQERYPRKVNSTDGKVQVGTDLSLSTNPATVGSVVAKSSTGNNTPEQGSSVDHAFSEISPQDDPSAQIEPARPTPSPFLAFTAEINRNEAQANAGSGTLADRQDSARVTGPKTYSSRKWSSAGFRRVDVKRRLIELWHQSLARSARSRSWTAISNVQRQEKKPPTLPKRTIDASG